MDTEALRVFACDIISNAGILLKLPQTAITTAQMLLQRVYHKPEYTFDRYPLDITSMAALFLASKIEEYPRKARDVIDVFTYVISKKIRREIILNYSEHERIREELITAERQLLKNLGFNLLSSYPQKIIVTLYHAILNALDPERNYWRDGDNQQLLQVAWNYCNDSMRTEVCIKYSQETVACACIHLACEEAHMPFPRSSDGRQWYNLFVENVADVEDTISEIKNLYQRVRAHPPEVRRYLRLAKF